MEKTMLTRRIIVTGGAGFIGSAVARYIIGNTRDHVCVVDKLTYAANLENLAPISQSDRFLFRKADICDKNAMDAIFQEFQPDIIMHLAAESHVDRSIDGPGEFIQTNIVGTYTLLECARKYFQLLPEEKKASFRFHHISTDEVFGDLEGPEDFSGKILLMPPVPRTVPVKRQVTILYGHGCGLLLCPLSLPTAPITMGHTTFRKNSFLL